VIVLTTVDDYRVELKTSVKGMRELIASFRFADRVMSYCAACPIFGRNWSCPPFDFDVDEFLARYDYAYIFGVKMIHGEKTREAYNTQKSSLKYSVWLMDNVNLKLLDILHGLERKYPGSRGASGGSCKICKSCARIDSLPCRFPEKMRNSIESLGFDVSMISKELLGLELVWMKDGLPPYQVLVNALFTVGRHDEIIF
jgi:predicted metal-binding protein